MTNLDVHVFTSTPYNYVGERVDFAVYISANDVQITNELLFQRPPNDPPLLTSTTFTLSEFPVATASTLVLTYEDSSVVTLTSDSLVIFNNQERVLLTNGLTGYPLGYLDVNSSRLDLINTTSSIVAETSSGLINATIFYEVPEFFSSFNKVSIIQIDYGDGTSESRPPTEFIPFSHVYNLPGNYNISIRAVGLNRDIPSAVDDPKLYEGVVRIEQEKLSASGDVFRVSRDQQFRLPYPNPRVFSNAWINADEINFIVTMLVDNLSYIDALTKMLESPPLDTNGKAIIRNRKLNWYTSSVRQNTSTPTSDLKIDNLCFNKNSNKAVIATNNTFRVYNYDYNNELLKGLSIPREGFVSSKIIKAIDVADNGNIYILDNLRLRVDVYNINPNIGSYTIIFGWGGLGGPDGNNTFYNPEDLCVAGDRLYVADTGNSCIKKYTLAGNWIQTYKVPFKPTKVTANSKYIYCIGENKLAKFDINGGLVFNEKINTTDTIIDIAENKGFIYLLTPNKVYRLFETGLVSAIFAERDSTIPEYQSIYSDNENNLYISNNDMIIRYTDAPKFFDMRSLQLEIPDNIYIQEEDFVAPLVYNKLFEALLIMHRDFFNSIDKIILFDKKDQPFISPLILSSGEIADEISSPFEDLGIGINEFVTPEVLNRNFAKIYQCQLKLLDIVTGK